MKVLNPFFSFCTHSEALIMSDATASELWSFNQLADPK
jgi:hypothetical protein